MLRREDEPWVQLATRIPKPLHQAVRLYCVKNDRTLMDFVMDALEMKLGKAGRRGGRRQASS